jgi:hypothetical protein
MLFLYGVWAHTRIAMMCVKSFHVNKISLLTKESIIRCI